MRLRYRRRLLAVGPVLVAAVIVSSSVAWQASAQRATPLAEEPASKAATSPTDIKTEKATFAAGCFWCVQSDFAMVPGVVATTTGYTGGFMRDPTYERVARGITGDVEAVQVVFDPKRVSYDTLLEWYWRNVDPVDGRGQFCDRGIAYRPVIFVHSAEQRRQAEESKAKLEKSGLLDRPIAVKIEDAKPFVAAEPEHQDYAKKRPWTYGFYRYGCGRDQRLKQIWRKARPDS